MPLIQNHRLSKAGLNLHPAGVYWDPFLALTVIEEPRPKVGASSKEKALRLGCSRPQTNIDHSSPCKARGILAFSRNWVA
jgi:hypothetical protein